MKKEQTVKDYLEAFFGLIMIVFIIFVVVSCNSDEEGVTKVSEEIESAYAGSMAQKADCVSKIIDGYEFVLCQPTDLWMSSKDGSEFYALNGKAITRSEKISEFYPKFKGTTPQRIDVIPGDILDVFSGESNTTEGLVHVTTEEQVSQSDIDNYCAYEEKRDDLTLQANKLFGMPDMDLAKSDRRAKWIEPKIAELDKAYFESKGTTWGKEFQRIGDNKIHCNNYRN
ncbi:MAG TPA: hypothetical protein VJA83_07815 [Sulfuricurvum sp.]|nr:hypothetical protein [Sulfuricurvum sp.]